MFMKSKSVSLALALCGIIVFQSPANAQDSTDGDWTLKAPNGTWTIKSGKAICDAKFRMTKPMNRTFGWTSGRSGRLGITFATEIADAPDWPISGEKVTAKWSVNMFPDFETVSASIDMTRSRAGKQWSYFAIVPGQWAEIFGQASSITVEAADGSPSTSIYFGDQSNAQVAEKMTQCAAQSSAK